MHVPSGQQKYFPYKVIKNFAAHSTSRDGISVNRYIGISVNRYISDLPIYRLVFQISDIGIGWHSTDIDKYRISVKIIRYAIPIDVTR